MTRSLEEEENGSGDIFYTLAMTINIQMEWNPFRATLDSNIRYGSNGFAKQAWDSDLSA